MRPGDVIAGRFEIDVEVASGGMGRIYRAHDKLAGHDVAIKVVLDADAEPDVRFAREAVVLADVAHPAVVRYVAHGDTPGGAPFLAMEWLEGEDLSDRLRRRRSATTIDPRSVRHRDARSGHLTPVDVLTLARRVASGLAALHTRGLVHRDIKPSNVFLPDGDPARAKILDFGLARQGNAFFLEEMIRAVASAGTVGLPDTVLGTLQARLDALGGDAKRVLRAGSVFGEVFWQGWSRFP